MRGIALVAKNMQVISSVNHINLPTPAAEWSSIQNNNNNEYYMDLSSGSYNNNNKNNQYWVVPVESEEICELIFKAEEDCWKNKHGSWDANKYHYHTGKSIFTLIKELKDKTYFPKISYCFIIMYPKPREIFAAYYEDRIVHHIIAPYMSIVAEAVHKKNGNVSFGNRAGKSSYHACLRVQEMMKKHQNGYIVTLDLKGYFMSIDRNIAWEIFQKYEEEYRPYGYTDEQRKFYLWLIELFLKYNPSINCEKKSPQWLWDEHIEPHKTMFNNQNGEPIGNYYAQIIANLILEVVCEALSSYDVTEFVDDFAIVVDNIHEVNDVIHKMDSTLSKMHLTRNIKKQYIQPVKHGVLWCGYMIFPNRMYISNRIIYNCRRKIEKALHNPTLENAKRLQQTLNSYFGMMSHATEHNLLKKISATINNSKYNEWLYFVEKGNHFVCKLKKKYSDTNKSSVDVDNINNYIQKYIKEYDYNTN